MSRPLKKIWPWGRKAPELTRASTGELFARRIWKKSLLFERRGVILSYSFLHLMDPKEYPLIILYMTCLKYPKTTILEVAVMSKSSNPCKRAIHSASLFVLWPSPQAKVFSIFPSGSSKIVTCPNFSKIMLYYLFLFENNMLNFMLSCNWWLTRVKDV